MGKIIIKIVLLAVFLIIIGFFISVPIFTNSETDEKINKINKVATDISYDDTKINFSNKEFLSLPSVVRKYLKRSINKEVKPHQSASLKMNGVIRPDFDSDWKQTDVELHHSLLVPGFVWISVTKEFEFLWTKTINSLFNSKAESISKFLSSITTDEAEGVKLDQNNFSLYILNSVFSPTALMPSQNIHWTSVSKNSAEVVIWYKSISGKAVFYFNQDGDVEKVVSEDMFVPNVIESIKENFTLSLANHKEFNGIKIPTYFEYQWNFSDGDVTVSRLNITSVEYK